ncbi:recombinase family protein [Caballeronia glebae]|uniref:recombinase family protein n=1 Tax=Caballeronia glebae TaxID=1777143 RepID=UPI0038B8D5E8
MNKNKRVGYVRVSSMDQNTDRQLDGIETDKLFTDKASGKDTKRPQLQAALDYVREGDVLVVHSMDRLARNTEDLLRTVRELKERHVSVQFVKEGITFSGVQANPMDDLMMTMLGGFAQFERAIIRERQREGIELAKAKGVYKGRKPSLSPEQVSTLRQRAAGGEPKATIARDLGISRETLYQYLRQQEAA